MGLQNHSKHNIYTLQKETCLQNTALYKILYNSYKHNIYTCTRTLTHTCTHTINTHVHVYHFHLLVQQCFVSVFSDSVFTKSVVHCDDHQTIYCGVLHTPTLCHRPTPMNRNSTITVQQDGGP